jgi:hypothetical protein
VKELEDMTNAELVTEERRLRGEAEKILIKARRCLAIRVGRDAAMQLREAALAKARYEQATSQGEEQR